LKCNSTFTVATTNNTWQQCHGRCPLISTMLHPHHRYSHIIFISGHNVILPYSPWRWWLRCVSECNSYNTCN